MTVSTYMKIRSNQIFLQNLEQRFVGPHSFQNHVNFRDEVFHFNQKDALFSVS